MTDSRSELIVSVGDLVEDIVIWTEGPVQAATDNPSTIVRTRGGGAANVAWYAATSGPARFIGRVGDDVLGRQLTQVLEDAGVDVRVQRAGRTGTIAILVDARGERTMYPDRAAAAELDDVPLEWVAGAGAVHVSGYCFANPTSGWAVSALMTEAREHGAVVSVDVASVDLLRRKGIDRVLELLRTCVPTVVFANADEARVLGLLTVGLPGSLVVIKDGPRPVTVIDAVVGRHKVALSSVVTDVRDSTGAGDAFAAAFLRAMLAGQDVEDCVRQGNELAAAVLSTPGAGMAPIAVDGPVRAAPRTAGTALPERDTRGA